MKTSLQQKSDPSDAKRWLIIGAYQAGASEKSVARIAGLSKTAVRNIILNYKRTGTPCLPKRESKKVRQKLLVEYDEEGNALVSDDDDENDNDTVRVKVKCQFFHLTGQLINATAIFSFFSFLPSPPFFF
ncbi:hypothetical protein BC940DRAFT_237438 [Gongronella butleri]|nr:hypothetical protein BC940DRAFT_237438 [Gongronella butleri]